LAEFRAKLTYSGFSDIDLTQTLSGYIQWMLDANPGSTRTDILLLYIWRLSDRYKLKNSL